MNLQRAILSTLAYHDIFDYPLTLEEVHKYLVGKRAQFKKVQEAIRVLERNKKIKSQENLFFLKGRGKIVKMRRSRGKVAKYKLRRAKLYSKLLALVPTIKLVAVSGALAMENSQKNDDIDLVIVTSKNTLWTTRLLANILLQPFRRKAGEPSTKDKACLNLFLEEPSLKIGNRNLYIAHEVAQMKPIWQRQNAYPRFIKANSWVKTYLPNWQPDTVNGKWKIVNRKARPTQFHLPFTINYSPIENLSKSFQLMYMRPKVTTERIGDHQLFFHPNETESWVLENYLKKLKKLHLDSKP